MKHIAILGSGYAVPKHCVSNTDLMQLVDTSDEWIVARTGIHTRYISDDETTSSLGYRAAVKAIEDAKIDKNEIDLIITATLTPDNFTPSTACLIQEKLGLNENHVMAFDLNAACSGFLFAMQTAALLLQEYKCALVIGAETLSRIIDWKDRNTCVLFGDGAGAVIMKHSSYAKDMYFYSQSIGDVNGILRAKGPDLHPTYDVAERYYHYLEMNGKEVFRFALQAMEKGILQILEKANMSLKDIDLFIPHQANIRIIKSVARRMQIPENKLFINLDRFGNTSAASIAMAFAQAKEQGILKQGMKIVLVGFGAGFTYASAFFEL